MQKDRFVFAIIIYGLILLTGAGICSMLLPEKISAEADIGEEDEEEGGKEVASQPHESEPTQPIEPTKEPEQSTADETGDEAETPNLQEQETATGAWALLSTKTTAEWREIIGERCIVFQKPERNAPGQELEVSLTEMPVERSVALRVLGCKHTEMGYEVIERIAGEQYFASEPLDFVEPANEPIDDPLRKMVWSCTLQEDGSHELYIEFLLDRTYVYNVYETETHYFIALRETKEVYDRIVVLDAGHGGWDTGTPSKDGTILEKNINLQVLLYLKELLEAADIKVYETRTTDRYIGQVERIAFANAMEADLFLSIHCNNAYQDAEAKGTEVLYTQDQESGSGISSEKLAQLCLEELVARLQLNDRGLQERGDDLTVLQKAEVPAVQVELAYMSNAEDMEVLKTEAAQRKAAEALCKAVLRAYDAMVLD